MKDEYGHYFEDTSIFQTRPEELEWIKGLKMTEEEFFEVFDWSRWWFPAGIKEFTGYLSWHANDPEYKEWPFQRNFANPRLVVFDTRPDMPDIQIVRILQLLSPPYGSQTCWRLNEAGCHLVNTKTGQITSVNRFPDMRYHPTRDWNMYPGHSKIHYTVGGYYGSLDYSTIPECAFLFRSMAPRTKPVRVFKELIEKIVLEGPRYKDGKLSLHAWMSLDFQIDLFLQGAGAEHLQGTWLWPMMYGGHRSELYGYIRGYWSTWRIGIRHGLWDKIKTPEDIKLYTDYLKILEKLALDMKNPKYIVPENIRVAHDKLSYEVTIRASKISKEELKRKTKIYQELHKEYLNRTWITKEHGLIGAVLQDIDEFRHVGHVMEFCIYSASYYNSRNYIIKFTDPKDNNKIIEVAEVEPETGRINQCRGYRNGTTEYHNEIINTLTNDRLGNKN